MPRYRQYTKEATEAGIGQVVYLSYRLSAKEVARIREQVPAASASILHRRLQEFAQNRCQWPNLKKIPYRFLMVDGTGVRLQGYKRKNLGRADMRWALASVEENKTWVPLNTNAVENLFSCIKNRIWNVGKRRSEKGLLNYLHVTMNKILLPEMWRKLWEQYMSLNPEFQLTNIQVSWRRC